MDLRNWTIVPKKSPNKPKIPMLSIIKPMKDFFINMNIMPTQKQIEPRILVGLVKNVVVLWGPIMKINPITNKIFPKAKKPESNSVSTPNRKKKSPPAVKPTPNSEIC